MRKILLITLILILICVITAIRTEVANANSQEETITVYVFFGNLKEDPNCLDCKKVYPVERIISYPNTKTLARATLEELLKGPTPEEEPKGFYTNINLGVIIKTLVIENGVAEVDFNEEIGAAGACKVRGICAQITKTLKQFPTIRKVVILCEDILQP